MPRKRKATAAKAVSDYTARFTKEQLSAWLRIAGLLHDAADDPEITRCNEVRSFVQYLAEAIGDRGLEMVSGKALDVLREVCEASIAERNRNLSAKANVARSNAALTSRANIDAMVRALPVGTTKKAAARQLEKDGAGSFTWLCNLFSQAYPGNSWPPKRAAKSQQAPGAVER
jgi:hypothetical protein